MSSHHASVRHGLWQEGPVAVVVDCNNHQLVLWHLNDGTVWKYLGSQGKELGRFHFPEAVAVTQDGVLVVTDSFNNRVQVLTVDGAVVCVLDPTVVWGPDGKLGPWLYGVAVCPGTHDILVSERDKHRVVVLSWSGMCDAAMCDQGVAGRLESVRAWGSQGAALGQLNRPLGLAVMSAGGVWVADRDNHRLCLLR
jgi:DNA-binding beta-propeller fold protein YncE